MDKKLSHCPIFIISLDTELIWGYVRYPRDRVVSLLSQDKSKGRSSIDILLQLFDKYHIPATWATVGHLFLDHCESEGGMFHKDMPRFKENWYSFDPGTDIQQDPLYYGKDILEKIRSSKIAHEIGWHTFSHVPFSECNREVAEAEIAKGIEIGKEWGITLKSFVFPEHKVGHLDILREYGIKVYRGSSITDRPANRGRLSWAPTFAASKIIAPPAEPVLREGIWEIPASLYFYDSQFPFTLTLRAKMGLRYAIRENKIFHIYLHPENLLMQPSLANKLDNFLAFVAKKRDAGILKVFTMGELASYLNSEAMETEV
ncbi:polysaccharide deacetylase family protein [Dehalococcoidia bacterium]|nr:polysaccharide deacetylase family protein [Dehalococcoidia bacterium]